MWKNFSSNYRSYLYSRSIFYDKGLWKMNGPLLDLHWSALFHISLVMTLKLPSCERNCVIIGGVKLLNGQYLMLSQHLGWNLLPIDTKLIHECVEELAKKVEYLAYLFNTTRKWYLLCRFLICKLNEIISKIWDDSNTH